MGKNQIEIGKIYYIGDVLCVAEVYNEAKEVLMVRDSNGNITFILGDFRIDKSNIIYSMEQTYSVKDIDFIRQIEAEMGAVVIAEDYPINNLITDIAKALHKKYIKIPTYLLEVVAEWYCKIKNI